MVQRTITVKVVKRGRKWLEVRYLEKAWAFQMAINDVSRDFEVGQTVRVIAEVDVKSNRYGVKTTAIPMSQISFDIEKNTTSAEHFAYKCSDQQWESLVQGHKLARIFRWSESWLPDYVTDSIRAAGFVPIYVREYGNHGDSLIGLAPLELLTLDEVAEKFRYGHVSCEYALQRIACAGQEQMNGLERFSNICSLGLCIGVKSQDLVNIGIAVNDRLKALGQSADRLASEGRY